MEKTEYLFHAIWITKVHLDVACNWTHLQTWKQKIQDEIYILIKDCRQSIDLQYVQLTTKYVKKGNWIYTLRLNAQIPHFDFWSTSSQVTIYIALLTIQYIVSK